MLVDNTTEVRAQKIENASTLEEVLDTRTPQEIEAQFLKEAEEAATKMAEGRDPADIAAMCFHMFYPRFSDMLGLLSKKQLRHVLESLVGRGHADMPEYPTFREKIAGDAYKIGLELLQAKFIMITKMEMDRIQDVVDKEEAKKLAESAVIETSFGAEALEEGNKNE